MTARRITAALALTYAVAVIAGWLVSGRGDLDAGTEEA